jgi:transcriptional regulator with XRE-family HTH domain
MSLADALNRALTKRLYPFSDISPKRLAHALGVDASALWRWKTGKRALPADALLALIAFFRARGDLAFESEIMSCVPRETLVNTPSGEPGWQVERLPISTLRHPTSQRLAALASTESDLLTAVDNAGLSLEISLYRRVSGKLVFLQAGKSTRMPQRISKTMLGLPSTDWPDRPYCNMVESRVALAEEAGPIYDRRIGLLAGKPAPYECLVLPGSDGFVVTWTNRLAA